MQRFKRFKFIGRVQPRHFIHSSNARMTSVLFGGGLNYQASNPLRIEIQRLQSDIAGIRKTIEGIVAENTLLKAKVAVLERAAATKPATVVGTAAPAAAAATGGGGTE
jgi:hypothetical protein